MGKKAPVRRVTTDAGNTYSKERKSGGGYQYRKNGKFCKPQAFSAGVGNVSRGRGAPGGTGGHLDADDGRWAPDTTVTVPTPDGPKNVRWDTASQAGQMANDSSVRDTIEIDGVEYSQAEIEEAFGKADPKDGQVVRY